MFASLQDRLSATFKNLRGKGRLSVADIDDTCADIRVALLEADVALPVVRTFVAKVKARAMGPRSPRRSTPPSRSSRSSTRSSSRSWAARRAGSGWPRPRRRS